MIFKFEPIYQTRVWGGKMFSEILGRNINSKEPIGESWDIVDRNETQSILSNTDSKGQSLRELIESNPKGMMGPKWSRERAFPILVKWLDCSERLSLQVHPPEKLAQELHAEPKTENWYVAFAQKGAGLYAGLKKGANRENFELALMENRAENLCHRISSIKNDSLLVKSGRIHAIDSGNLILEIQQNSDSTFRVYDWRRTGLDGKSRELHIKESLKCINFEDFEPTAIRSSDDSPEEILADCKYFRIRKFNCKEPKKIKIKEPDSNCALIHVVEGSLQINDEKIIKGEHAMSPYAQDCLITSKGLSTFLVTDNFV